MELIPRKRITFADVQNVRGMKIEKDFPPNIAEIEKVFPGVTRRAMRGVYFCYGATIYNPSGRIISPELLAHECTHAIQTEQEGGPELWWQLYLEAPSWRFEWEFEAHRVEYEYTQLHENRHFRRRALKGIAARLAGPLYGHMTTTEKARRLITEKIDG